MVSRDLPRHHVSSSTVVYAIRYGMGRMTYADQDARDLVRAHWADMHPTDRQVVRDDITAHLRFCAAHLDPEVSHMAGHYRAQYGRWRFLLDHLDDEKMPAEPLGTPIYDETDGRADQ